MGNTTQAKGVTRMSTDLIKLYSTQILALAADMPHIGRLDQPMATSRQRSPLCGSTVTVDISVEDGRVSAFGQDVKACALGQAAASVIGAQVIGQDRATVQRGRDQLHAMLTAQGPAPDAPWDGLHVLAPAAEFKNRHASILLCFDAILDGFAQLNTPA